MITKEQMSDELLKKMEQVFKNYNLTKDNDFTHLAKAYSLHYLYSSFIKGFDGIIDEENKEIIVQDFNTMLKRINDKSNRHYFGNFSVIVDDIMERSQRQINYALNGLKDDYIKNPNIYVNLDLSLPIVKWIQAELNALPDSLTSKEYVKLERQFAQFDE